MIPNDIHGIYSSSSGKQQSFASLLGLSLLIEIAPIKDKVETGRIFHVVLHHRYIYFNRMLKGFTVPTDFKALIQRFYHLQSERVETYRLFEEGHEAYLRTGPHYDFDHYRQLVHEITQAFCGISKEVLEIKGRLHHEFDRPALSEHIEKLQSKEKQKLELTARLQLARQRAQDHPEEEGCQEQIQEIKQEIIKNKEALSEIMQDFKYDSEECD